MLDGDGMRARFERAYAERRKAGYQIPVGRGVWVFALSSGGQRPSDACRRWRGSRKPADRARPPRRHGARLRPLAHDVETDEDEESPLTIAEAKRRLALNFGVNPANVRITIEACAPPLKS